MPPISSCASRIGQRQFLHVAVMCAACFLVVGVLPHSACEARQDLAPVIEKLNLGMSEADLRKLIQDPSSLSRADLKRPGRYKLVWKISNSPTYKRLELEFTRKNRLFNIRYVLRDELRWQSKPVKKKLFKKFGISWEYPDKKRIKDKDVIVYAPLEGTVPNAFDITDVVTGEKSVEIFHRLVSAQDRQKPKKKAKDKPSVEKNTSTSPTQSSEKAPGNKSDHVK